MTNTVLFLHYFSSVCSLTLIFDFYDRLIRKAHIKLDAIIFGGKESTLSLVFFKIKKLL